MPKFPPMSDIWGIVLAAGESKRMNSQKLLLPFDGKPMIEIVIENIAVSSVDKIMVVTGSHKEEIIGATFHLSVTHCYNDNYKQGMLSSVKCGIRALPKDCEAVMIFLGDQPLIPVKVVNLVIGEYKSSGKGIVIPTCGKRRGHPLLIDRKYHKEIEQLDEQEGLRELAHKYADDVLEIETGEPGILRDIDTREEYLNAIKQKQRQYGTNNSF
jgi:molybdenum cofactor cytidylyltransferase